MSTTATLPRLEELEFPPPDGGSWTTDLTHMPEAATRYLAELEPEAFERGFVESMRRYGVLMNGPKYAYINDFAYTSLQPAPEDEIPARFEAAERAFETRLWRDDLRRWDAEVKPRTIEAHLALQREELEAMSDEDLLDHLARAREHHRRMITQHHQFNGACLVPTGDFLVQAMEWTGLPPGRLLELLRGTAPTSAGQSDGLERLVAALRAAGPEELLAGEPGEVITRLRAADGEVGEAARAYLDSVLYRLFDGFDICMPTNAEKPGLVAGAIRAATVDEGAPSPDGVGEALAEVREAVPGEHRDQFDDLLEEARLTYRLRDERGVYSDIWAAGLVRRAAIAAGERLVTRGRIAEPVHFAEAGWGEMQALLRGEDGPSAEELALRKAFRDTYKSADAPQLLGPEPPPPPPLGGLPPAAARMMRAFGAVMGLLFDDSEDEHEEAVVRGIPASSGVCEGTACVVTGPAELDRLSQGQILVALTTSEAFNVALPLLSGIVTDAGGVLSHAAIVAREFGLPSVVGTREATKRIPDGARIRVDGGSGEVTILS